jgi:uncharacterized protein YciI
MSSRWKLSAAIAAALSLQAQSGPYYVAFLRPYAQRKAMSGSQTRRMQSEHEANMRQLADDGDLVASGPCDDTPTTISGLFILKVDSLREAREIAVHDPTVLKRRNTVDVYAWHGPEGIGDQYVKLHQANPDAPDNMQPHPLGLFYRGSAWANGDPVLAAHERYIEQLRKDGKLGAAGDIDTPDDLYGLVFFKVMSVEDAQLLLSRDPAVRARVLRVEWHRWLTADHVLPW